jgi:hypothetical protein
MRLGRALEDEGETIDTRDRNATRYKTYTLPGGENYRELLLTLPEAKQEGRAGTVTFADDDPVDDFLTDLAAGSLSVDEMDYGAIEENGRRNKVKFDGLMPEEAIEFQKLAARYNGRVVYKPASKPAPAFRSSHFYEENVLAHVRFDDRTDANGNKVLFIEEIQSDWAQAGRKRGFGDAAKKLPAGYTLKTDGGNWWVENAAGKMVNPYKRPSRAEAIGEAINGRSSGEQYHRNLEDGKSIPAGPFVTKTEAWAGLALRRIIRWAAERGYDSVAWTTGDQQAERYDLSKHVRDLHYAKHGDTYWLAATLHNGKEHGFGNAIEPDKLDDYVGKAVAEKIRNGEGAKHPTDTSRRTLRGLDLKVGGKGMRAFYDKIVPNVANDILKKMGGGKVGKVGVIGINATSDDDLGNPVEQPGFDITPALREAAMGGMPLFSKSEHRIGTAGATARGARDELPGKTPAPAPDESFVVYRVGTAPSLLNRNAGNANAVARHLLAHDSVDLPVGAGIGDTIMAFRVTAKKFGAYEGMRGGKPSQADGVGRVVRGKEVAYSFPEGAWWEGELIDSIPVSEVRNVLRHRGVRDASFDEAGTDAGADAIRRAFDRRANFEADKRAQVAWLNAQAGKLGYWDAEELATKDPAAFQRFAEEWRAKTPTALFSRRSAPASPAQQAADRLASRSSRFRPVEAVTKAAVQVVGLDRASGWAYDKLLELIARLTPEKVKAGVVADFGIPEAVTDRRVAMQAAQRQHLREVEKVIAALGGLTRAESRVAYEWMNADNPQAADYFRDQLPPESIAVLADVEKMVDQLSAEAIRLGQMTADERERNRFAYLRRSYVKHTAELTGQERARRSRAIAVFGDQYKGRGIADAVPMSKVQNLAPEFWKRKLKGRRADASLRGEKFIRLERRAPAPGAGSAPLEGIGPAQAGQGRLLEVIYWPAAEEVPARYSGWEQSGPTWEVRGTKGENLVMWRDFTKAEREQMGEIDEIKYAVARTMQGMIHDVETGRYLEWLANTQARPNANHIPAGKIIEAKESLWHTFARDEWVQVPDSKIPGTSVLRYGKLAGKYLPGPIWNDVRQTVNQNFQPLGEYYAAVLRAWKVSKTALSPAVHMNNVMANVVMADWHDVGAGQILKALDILIHQDNPANKIIVDRFEDAGGSIGTFSISELQREQLAPLIEQLRRDMGQGGDAGMIGAVAALQLALSGKFREALSAAASSKAARGVEVAAKAMIDLYQTEDVVFRLAAFIRAKEDGSSDRDAGKLARQSFLDYHINAPWIQMMRSTALPFVSFTYRAAPMLLEIAAKKPWKLLKLALFAGALNAIGYAFSGGDEDKERKLLPEEKAGRIFGFLVPKLIRMPWNDAHGSPVFLDIRRWIPVGDIFDTGQTHSAVPVLPMAIPGGPLAVLAELLFNRSQFTGREITKDTDTGVEKAKKVFDHLYKAIAPNLLGLPGTYATKGVVDAATGKTDAFGREQGTAQAILSSVGVKVAAYPGDVGMKNLRAKRDHDLREISETMSALRRERAKNGISQSDFEKRMAEQVAKREKVNREFAGKLN